MSETSRYSVALPFSDEPASLGNSKHLAERRFLSLERRLIANPAIKLEYDKIIKDYLDKDYITPVNDVTYCDSSCLIVIKFATNR